MNKIVTQQSEQKDIIKIILLFTALGLSAYITYRISKSLADEITNHIS